MAQPYLSELFGHAAFHLAARQVQPLQAQRDVALHAQPREQARFLKRHADVRRRQPGWFTVDQHLPGVVAFQPGQHAQQGGFAAAAGADDGDELAGGNVQVDAGQHRRAGAVVLADAAQDDAGGNGDGHGVGS